MRRIRLALILVFYPTAVILAQQPQDSAAYFKKVADNYRKAGFPEAGIPVMVQMEREKLYPEIKHKADEKRNAEGRKRAKAYDSPSDDAEAQKMMDNAVQKMGKNPEDVKKKMAEVQNTSTGNEIPKLSAKVIAATPASETALLAYLNALQKKADGVLSSAKKSKASQYTGKGRETGYAGIAFWINKEHDVSLYLMLKACIATPNDLLLLNNFASCLSMIGLPDKAIPILDYVSKKIPSNANVLSNLGHAWLSLGNVTKAKPYLEKTIAKDDTHPEANRSLAKIALKESNKAKASEYLGKSMSGGFSMETYNTWRQIAPGKDVAMLIRSNHKHHYKETPITKRWILPEVPSSVKDAQDKEQAIQQYFANIDATLSDMSSKIPAMQNSDLEKQGQQYASMEQQVKNMKTLDDVQRYNRQFGTLVHPLKAQAQLMLNGIRENDYATSYSKRIAQAEQNRSKRVAQLNTSFQSEYSKISSLRKEASALEGGEHADDESKLVVIEKSICTLNREIQAAQLKGQAEINTQYIRQVEDILNQRMQEEMYWTALYTLPNDPSGALYGLYENYLKALSGFHNLYPIPAPLQVFCDGERDPHKTSHVTGKLQQWEDSHCPIDINIRMKVVEASMNCHEIKLAGKINGVTVAWDRKIDVVTWETLEHSISVSGGLGEYETNITDNLKGKAGLDGKVTIKLGADLVPTDLIVKAEAGVELTGPLGGKASADIGNLEISIQGGLRGDGPVPDMATKMFGDLK